MTPVKDQGGCGSCWAFGAVGLVEAIWDISSNNPNLDLDLSEQYLVSDCCLNCGACQGGSTRGGLLFFRDQGVPDEGCMPYTDGYSCNPYTECDCTYSNPELGICSDATCSDRCVGWQNRVVKISKTEYLYKSGDRVIKQLLQYGPVGASISVMGYYDGDIVRCDDWMEQYTNHAVVIIGYDDFGGYWIMKNSWGSDFGEDGYFKVGYGECLVGDWIYYASNQLTMEGTPFGGCYDSDGGKDIFNYGFTTLDLGAQKYDGCEPSDPTRVYETFCENGEQEYEWIECPTDYYCLLDGRCVQNGCYDSDGGLNKYTEGFVQTIEGDFISEDECIGETRLKEVYCDSNGASSEELDCDIGQICEYGRCKTNSTDCDDECYPPGRALCAGETGYQTCGNWDTDLCDELGPPTDCLSSGGAGPFCGVLSNGNAECVSCRNSNDCSNGKKCVETYMNKECKCPETCERNSYNKTCGKLNLCGDITDCYCSVSPVVEFCGYDGQCYQEGRDSDYGKDFRKKGTVAFANEPLKEDYCLNDDLLVEYYCAGGYEDVLGQPYEIGGEMVKSCSEVYQPKYNPVCSEGRCISSPTCESMGYTCGTWTIEGKTIECGSCGDGEFCNWGTECDSCLTATCGTIFESGKCGSASLCTGTQYENILDCNSERCNEVRCYANGVCRCDCLGSFVSERQFREGSGLQISSGLGSVSVGGIRFSPSQMEMKGPLNDWFVKWFNKLRV